MSKRPVMQTGIAQRNACITAYMQQEHLAPDNLQLRQKVSAAIRFMESHGSGPISTRNQSKFFEKLNGIDFTQPVEVRTLQPGDKVYSMQTPGFGQAEIKQGAWYAPTSNTASTPSSPTGKATLEEATLKEQAQKRGISQWSMSSGDSPIARPEKTPTTAEFSEQDLASSSVVDKEDTEFTAVQAVEVLVSHARKVNDTWSVKPTNLDRDWQGIETMGGGMQMYLGEDQKAKANLRTAAQILVDEALTAIESGTKEPTDLTHDERMALYKEIKVAYDKGSFLRDKPWGQDAFKEQIARIEKISTVLDNSTKPDKPEYNSSDSQMLQIAIIKDLADQGLEALKPAPTSPAP